MDPHYTYFLILACSLAGPLAFSFDKKVAFYKKWRYVFPAMILPALFYIAWDYLFILNKIWSFNERYITGIKLLNIPVEEILFFFVVPYCCVFIYECIIVYFPSVKNKKNTHYILLGMALLLLFEGNSSGNRYYSSFTFLFTALFFALYSLFHTHFRSFNAGAFLLSYLVILIPFLVVNGLLTAIPVVLYNNDYNMGLRLYTIPIEDIFYGMLLVFLNIVIYEKLK